MSLEIIASSLLVAVVSLSLLAWKWHIGLRTGILAGTGAGLVTALIVGRLEALFVRVFDTPLLIFLELFLVLVTAGIAAIIRFYRDPERFPAETGNVILSPADGKIIYVNKVENSSGLVSVKKGRRFTLHEIAATDLLADDAYLIGIDMNLLNVHVNRAPIAGQTLFWKRTPGGFISLGRPEAETVNERVTTIIAAGAFRVGVIQIASRLVRRIVSYAKQGDHVELGQRIGAIVFGSQVDVVVPATDEVKILVKPGDRVLAGVSVIGRHSPAGESTERR